MKIINIPTLCNSYELSQNQHIQPCEWTTPINPTCERFWKSLSCEYATEARGIDLFFHSFKKIYVHVS